MRWPREVPAGLDRMLPAVSRPPENESHFHVEVQARATAPHRIRLVAKAADWMVLDVPMDVHSRS